MHIREFQDRDFPHIFNWIESRRVHALWCADLFQYPVSPEAFRRVFTRGNGKFGDIPVSYVDKNDIPVGFCTLNVNSDKQGFLKFIIVDSEMRGKGIGRRLISSILHCAARKNVTAIKLNVFDCNMRAIKCYKSCGFTILEHESNAFQFNGETWGRYQMSITLD